jgi:hypothetical protein
VIENLITVVISVFSGAIVTYIIIKKMFNPLEILEESMDFLVNDSEMQKKIYVLGALIGNGIKSGVGLNPKTGKFKLDDLISMALASFFGNKLQTQQQTAAEMPWFMQTPKK